MDSCVPAVQYGVRADILSNRLDPRRACVGASLDREERLPGKWHDLLSVCCVLVGY